MADSLQERVIALERMVNDLRAGMDSVRAREAVQGGNIPYRLARVTNDPVTGDNTFSIVFLDGTYSPAAGDQTPTFTQRQLSSKTVVHNLNRSKIDKDSEILVFPWGDRWWTWHGTAAEPQFTTSDVAVVEVFESYGKPDLDPVTRLPEWVYPGRKVNPALTQGEMDETDADDPWLSGEDVWLVDISHGSITTTLLHNERYIGYKLGTMVIGQASRPLYAIRHFQEQTGVVQVHYSQIDPDVEVSSNSRIWSGKLVVPDTDSDVGWGGDANYDEGKYIWLVDINRVTRRETLQNFERFNAVKLASSFDHDDDPRELWAIKDDPRPAHIPFIAFAVNDVEHNTVGTFKIATGASFATAVAGTNTVSAHNPLAKIWKNSKVIIDRVELQEDDVQELAVMQAFSATRIRGTAYTSISPGTTGTIDAVVEVDGHFDAATATVKLPTVEVAVVEDAVVWAELRYDTTSHLSAWEIYSADCPP